MPKTASTAMWAKKIKIAVMWLKIAVPLGANVKYDRSKAASNTPVVIQHELIFH